MRSASLRLSALAGAVLFCLALGAAACGSGGQGTGRDGAASCPAVSGVAVSWQDNGLGHCGTGSIDESSGSNGVSGGSSFEVTGYDASGNSFDLGVRSLVPGTYSCGGDAGAIVYLRYWHQTASLPEVAQSCSITITSIGGSDGNASGTFSASLATTEGGTEEISNGMFDGMATIGMPI